MNATEIRAELDRAAQLDAEAREHRNRAGTLLRQARDTGGLRSVYALARDAGIDSRMVELLLQTTTLSHPQSA